MAIPVYLWLKDVTKKSPGPTKTATSFIPIRGTNAPPPKLLVIFRAVTVLAAFAHPGHLPL